ncbi:pyruvate carboxylase [Marinilongibacter aquaticus]|uniref:pyruvate carboxylase n=1 Tax=Marinilongibacter aquaticus TaxID=2975157 RepID=UPI0021BD1159|nr:pyruvate carboxylase [Marinilongibacter aquaticus]UBM57568.1 pyruvate carboxylase [Marinilongibacter aquaticus]
MKEYVKPIKRLLVANRGEIAIRIMRAASELGITTVALYTFEDRYSLHRYKADEAYQIGSEDDALKPYLDIEGIINLAKSKKIDGIHPGYGFLSENVQLVRRCGEEGIIFVGPSADAMDALGDKKAAKNIAVKAGVPLIPDYREDIPDVDFALERAKEIGFPVMIKAVAGGGGRGMRVVRNEEDFGKSFNEAKNEAKTAFGNDVVFLEKFVEEPKHLEVQLLGDTHGNLIHLYERDCSVQRRFQKVVEVAPSFGLKAETRQTLYESAIKIGKAVNYSNAGTVEFLVDKQENVYFIEVNPRIQVEHTITEEVTGIDIVRTQLLIAMGYKLSDNGIYLHNQDEVPLKGYAIQCRVTTEDPANGFKPDFGTIIAYRNAAGFGIRLDEGSAYAGMKISPYFDSMIVKVTARGRTMKGAAQRLSRALVEFRIRGVKTNIPFLHNVINNKTFQKGQARVSFIENHPELMNMWRSKDRSTRALRLLADVIVNGNKTMGKVEKRDFPLPKTPEIDPFADYPNGNKQRLEEMGPEKFAQWVKDQKPVLFTDTTFRDGHQSLLATRVRTKDMLAVAEGFAKTFPQLFSMEVWGGATFDVAMRFLYESPWRRLQEFREAMPNMLLQMLLRGSNAVGYTAYPDNLVESFIEKSAENGIDVFRIFDSLNWIESMKLSIKTVRERTNSIAEAAICYTGEMLDPAQKKYTLQYYLDMARQLEDAGAHMIAIKDMAGLLKPYTAEVLVKELKKAVDLPIHLHTHDTSSIQSSTYLKAVESGVDIVDCALGGMSGLTSQPNFNSVASMLIGHERECELDMDKLNQYSSYWEDVRNMYAPFESGLKSGSAEVYKHEMPGGQYSNLKSQSISLGLGDKFDLLKENYSLVNKMFGDIVKVTPSSKVVGDMALFMTSNNLSEEDIYKKGDTLSFPESVKGFFKGDLGQPPGGFPKELQKIILKDIEPYTDRPNSHLPPIDLSKEFEQFQKDFPGSDGYLDFLAYKLYDKVYEEFHENRQKFGDVSIIPSHAFWYGLYPNEEILIKIEEGKTILVRYLYTSEPDDEGKRTVSFELNGQTRKIKVRDHDLKVTKPTNKKVGKEGDIGAPLQGRISRILVKKGDEVAKNTPLFVIEAMKMESIVASPYAGTVSSVQLEEGSVVEQDDWVIEIEKSA